MLDQYLVFNIGGFNKFVRSALKPSRRNNNIKQNNTKGTHPLAAA